jgi:ribonuclease R
MKLATLAEFAAGFGLKLRGDLAGNPSAAIGDLMTRAEGRPEYRWIGQLALRSMKQALYSLNNIGHFGLASKSYCHFTSPIRRYPDLVVHRLLRAFRTGKGLPASDAGGELDSIAQSSSERERNAEAAERELLAWKKVAYIGGREGEEFDGVVTGVAAFGLFVQLEENLVEGLIKVDMLGGGRYAFDEARMLLRPRTSGRAFRLGDKLRVRVDRVDRILRRVDMSLADGPSPASANRPAESGNARRTQRKRRPTADRRGSSKKGRGRRRR